MVIYIYIYIVLNLNLRRVMRSQIEIKPTLQFLLSLVALDLSYNFFLGRTMPELCQLKIPRQCPSV